MFLRNKILIIITALLLAGNSYCQDVHNIDDIILDNTTLESRYQFWYRQPIQVAYQDLVTVMGTFPLEVEMKSEVSITMRPGFEVRRGAQLHAYIDDVDMSSEMQIHAGDDKVYCFDGADYVDIQLGGNPTIEGRSDEILYSIVWYPDTYIVGGESDVENPTIRIYRYDVENGTIPSNYMLLLRVTDNYGNEGYDVISLVNCDDVDPYTGVTLTNYGANISVGSNTSLSVYGNVYNTDGGVAGINDKQGKWINEGTIAVSQDWGNDGASTFFVPESMDPAVTAETDYAGLVDFIGEDQTIYGTQKTIFNNLDLTGLGVKHLDSDPLLTEVKGVLNLYSSKINCHASTLLIDNDDVDAIIKEENGAIITYNEDDTQGWLMRKMQNINPQNLTSSAGQYVFPIAGKQLNRYKYRPVIIGSYSDDIYFKSSFVFEEPASLSTDICPNTNAINQDYYYQLQITDETGAVNESFNGMVDIIMCTNPDEDSRLTAVSHLDDEPAYRSDVVPVWKYTGRIFYAPAETPDVNYATFEGFYECGIKEWTDFNYPSFTLIEAGLAIFTDELACSSYLENYPSEEEADAARIDASQPNVFTPRQLPLATDRPFTIELNSGENSTSSTINFYVDRNMGTSVVNFDPDGSGTEYVLSPDLLVQGEDNLALFDLSSRPRSSENECSSSLIINLKDGLLLTPYQSTYNVFSLEGIANTYDLSLQVFDKTGAVQQNSGNEDGIWNGGLWRANWNPGAEGVYTFTLQIADDAQGINEEFHGQFIVDFSTN